MSYESMTACILIWLDSKLQQQSYILTHQGKSRHHAPASVPSTNGRNKPNIMCFYENHRFSCGDWRWGNFRQHCQREYRTGETCGTKMIFRTVDLADKCTMCEKIERKKRRYEKAQSDYNRWLHDSSRQASAAKAYEDMNNLYQELARLVEEKNSRYRMIGRKPSSPSGTELKLKQCREEVLNAKQSLCLLIQCRLTRISLAEDF